MRHFHQHLTGIVTGGPPQVHLSLQSGLPERAHSIGLSIVIGGEGRGKVNNKTNVANVTATPAALTNDIIIELVYRCSYCWRR